MDSISAADATETAQSSIGSTSSSLRVAIADWLSSRQATHSGVISTNGAEVCIAKAFKREERPPVIYA